MNRRLNVVLVLLSLCVALNFASTARAEEKLRQGDRLAICGDSITEQKLYCVYMEEYILMCKPAADLRVCQFGWSGERAPGFRDRMVNDAMWYKPTAATTAYGMNDGQYKAYVPETGKVYGDAMRTIVQNFKKGGVRLIVVGSPGCTDPAYMKGPIGKEYNPVLSQLRDVAREVAKDEGVNFANVFDAMLEAQTKAKEKYGEKFVFAGGDGFHPSPNGHIAMAYAFLKGLGCDGNIGTITVDLSSGKAEASEGHKVVSASGGKVEVESSKYPFCFAGKPDEPSTRNGAEVTPFNEDLNRFVLKVKNPGADKLKVTWGKATKDFSADQLDKGINLAAEFMDDNPFSDAFFAVEAKVKEKQNFETPLHKDLLNRIPLYKRLLPDEQDAFEKLVAAGAKRQQALSDAAIAAVKPVKHTISVEK